MTDPALPDSGAIALFLDFDGTLVEIAPTPDAVRVAPDLPALLRALQDRLGGALALVSGRPIAQIDALVTLAGLPVAGSHGLERRRADGTVIAAAPSAAIATVRDQLLPFVLARPGVMLEDKLLSLALHYRNAPEREAECRAAVAAALEATHGLVLLDGKMVLEIRPHGMDKGRAIAAFLAEPPFLGRWPVFLGDDRTDEDGFATVAARDGLAIKVGAGPSLAPQRLPDVAAVHDWLRALATQPASGPRLA